MGFFAHAQTVDTRPLFPSPTWPGYEAKRYSTVSPTDARVNIASILGDRLKLNVDCYHSARVFKD